MREAYRPVESKGPYHSQKIRRHSDDEGAAFHSFWVPRGGIFDSGLCVSSDTRSEFL